MSNGHLEPSSLEQSATARAERFFLWAQRWRVALMGAALAILLAFGASLIVSQRRQSARQRLTDAFAQAVAISDAPLISEVEEAEKALAERRAERVKALQERREDKRAQAKASRAADGNSSAAEDDEADEAEEIEAEAAMLAEQQAEDEAIERRKRGLHPFASVADRNRAAQAAFTVVADDPTPSRLRALATLELAHAAGAQNDRLTARTRLEALYNETRASDDLWSIVASRYATALEAAGEPEEALTVLSRFGEGEQRLLADEAGVQRARLLVAKGEAQAAREVLENVQLRFPNSPIEDEIRAALLEMPAAKPSAPDDVPAAAPTPAPSQASAPAP